MVFSSLPAYHHHDPSNWQQQPNHPITGLGTTSSSTITAAVITSQQLHSPQLPPPPPPPSQSHGGGGAGSIRPGSMADRARMANIPMPEAALKCPRCESTNTKFCYFNNYSLTQPRHFCKTCRRYWTRGGALRNVPVGGGCRRNKRSKGTSSSGSGSSSKSHAATASGSSGGIPSNNSGTASAADILGLTQQLPAALRFMAPLHHHQLGGTDFTAGGGDIGLNYGLNYGASDLNFHIGGASSLLSSIGGGVDHWRLPPPPQFPFLPAGLDPNSSAVGLFEGDMGPGFSVRPKQQSSSSSSAGITHQMAAVKMEDYNNRNNQGEMNLSRQFLGMNSGNHDQYWSGGNSSTTSAWTDLSGFSSSSATSNQL